ncbi:MAG: YraN family protein, partial [Bacteroidales bacterium]|nr:YraN family protein [Bacteroidales bacterium]
THTTRTATAFRRWPFWRRWFGRRSERVAAQFLRRLGYRIIAINSADRFGELDLIAWDGSTIIIVEVRSTSANDPTIPAASVDHAKQKRLTEAALRFLHTRRLLNYPARFDVIAIAWPEGQREPTIVHYPHAFEATGRFQLFQ